MSRFLYLLGGAVVGAAGFTSGRAADYVRERVWADEQKIQELDDGRLLLELTTRSEPEVMSWMRSFGDEAEWVHRTP